MKKTSLDSFHTRATLAVGGQKYEYFSLSKGIEGSPGIDRLPYCHKILLENLLRHEDGESVTTEDIQAVAGWDPHGPPEREIAFTPARVLLQDFTGVPAIVDLAVMRDAIAEMGGEPSRISPLVPSDLVIDHSVQVDSFGAPDSVRINTEREYQRNGERYAFLRWGQTAFDSLRVIPPATGICHQVNLEYLAQVVFRGPAGGDGKQLVYPDTLVGTDSHTTMVNGLGVLGWGVGGIEAEASMLGQAISFLIPEVVGFRLVGRLPEGATATDLVLTITEMLRAKGVVGKFVEFYGPGIGSLTLADRATIGNMSPEYGATCAIFPIDEGTLDYLRFTARSQEQVGLVEAYAREQGLFHTDESPEPVYSDGLELDLADVEPSLAGPKRPQDRISLRRSKEAFQQIAKGAVSAVPVRLNGDQFELGHGAVVIAAITSCTNTSNPVVMIGAGLLAKKAVERGLQRRPWVKTSLAPGSKVVPEYLQEAGLLSYLEQLGFNLVGFGCTTCIGNSGPLPKPVSKAVQEGNLIACAVLSGNRNFEGRINPEVQANYLASPPLVVAYALAGRMDLDLYSEPLGEGSDGQPVYLKDVWPTQQEIEEVMRSSVKSEMFSSKYADVFTGDEVWQSLPIPKGDRFLWKEDSTYIRQPTFFKGMPAEPNAIRDLKGLKVLARLGDSVTTDHISPAGAIPRESPAARYLMDAGVRPEDFNSYGSRRGNHEVMVRGTFGNIRLRNLLVPGTEGGYTLHPSSPDPMSIYDAAMKYREEGTPLLVIAGKEYGSGSSRDWAAKGVTLLGVQAVLAESYERIHRSNLIGMGVLPLQFEPSQDQESLGLTGLETYDLLGLDGLRPGQKVQVRVVGKDGSEKTFKAIARVDTPNEVTYYQHGGILHYVLRSLLKS